MVINQEPHREKGAPISTLGFYSAGELRGELRFLLQLPRAPQLSLGPGCLGGLPIGALGPWVSSGLPFVPLVLVMAWWPNYGCGPSVLGPPLLHRQVGLFHLLARSKLRPAFIFVCR